MYTYQDFESDKLKSGFVAAVNMAITSHIGSEVYKVAKMADEYDHQQNVTIKNFVKIMYNAFGEQVEDFATSNNKICSNFFHKLNVQRCNYLLGNGVTFSENVEKEKVDGIEKSVDTTKAMLGNKFDTELKSVVYYSLIHGESFGYWNNGRLYNFKLTEFVPLKDEETGSLRAGIRFWRIDKNKPTIATVYEEDGYTKLKSKTSADRDFEIIKEKTPYKVVINTYAESQTEEVVGVENYPSLPIISMWGSNLHQSTLIGMREKIDSFDLIRSGFANDLNDCAEIFWIVENAGGMSAKDLDDFLKKLKLNHIANVDSSEGASAKPYTQEIPYQARKEYLNEIRSGIYEDFCALDVHTVSAGATNDHIDAAYQPMDDEADDLEFQVIEFVQSVLSLIGIEDTPVFKRNRISNQKEQTDMVLSAANYLDDETILTKLPFVAIDEIPKILYNKEAESNGTFTTSEEGNTDDFQIDDVDDTDDEV